MIVIFYISILLSLVRLHSHLPYPQLTRSSSFILFSISSTTICTQRYIPCAIPNPIIHRIYQRNDKSYVSIIVKTELTVVIDPHSLPLTSFETFVVEPLFIHTRIVRFLVPINQQATGMSLSL
jgi:hypothetical protein